MVQSGDIQGLADRAVRPIGDAAHRMRILGGDANQVITDRIGLVAPLLGIYQILMGAGFLEKNPPRVEDPCSEERAREDSLRCTV